MKTVYVHKLIFIMQTKQTLQMTVLKIVFQTDNFANKFKVTIIQLQTKKKTYRILYTKDNRDMILIFECTCT